MLVFNPTSKKLTGSGSATPPVISSLGSVRWMRRVVPKPGKPPNLPPSKRVLYRIPPARWERPEFVSELLWRRHVYNNAVESMREVFRREVREVKESGVARELDEARRLENEEFEKVLAANAERNRRLAEERLRQLESRMEALKVSTSAEIEKIRQEEAADVVEKTREIEELIAISPNFITPENLTERIEEALEQPVVYEYVIDLQGQKLYSPVPVKYAEGVPTKQTGRLFDLALFKKFGPSPPNARVKCESGGVREVKRSQMNSEEKKEASSAGTTS